jgi:hypothetical protein
MQAAVDESNGAMAILAVGHADVCHDHGRVEIHPRRTARDTLRLSWFKPSFRGSHSNTTS